jgi:5-methylcytosine-specific restriction enzyme A
MRKIEEWIGRSDDTPVPARVRLRIFERCQGICHLSGRKIQAGEPWDLDHVVALCNGGEHRESNLAPAIRDKHREKTKADVAEKSVTYRKRLKHHGLKKPKGRPIPGSKRSGLKRKMDGTVVRR